MPVHNASCLEARRPSALLLPHIFTISYRVGGTISVAQGKKTVASDDAQGQSGSVAPPEERTSHTPVTILAKLIAVLLILAGLAYGAVWALATLVTPDQREVTVQVPAAKFAR